MAIAERSPDSGAGIVVSVVIVNWNVRDLLLDCLASVYESAGPMRIEVIVVDNASGDGSADAVAARFPAVVLIRNSRNNFFSPANNQGAAVARGRYILFLNPDTRVLPAALPLLTATLEAHPEMGVVGARLLDREGRWSRENGYRLPSLRTVINEYSHINRIFPWPHVFPGIVRNVDFDGVDDCEWVCGAALMIRREVFAQEQWNEKIFLFAEDVEYCERILARGWRIAAVAGAEVVHYSGQSMRQQDTALPANKLSGLGSLVRKRQGAFAQWLAIRAIQLSFLLRSYFHSVRYWLVRDELARDKAKRLRQYLALEKGRS